MEEQTSSVEGMGIDKSFWSNKVVFLTGHTGFKGSWLTLWLSALGAKVFGYALPPNTSPSLFQLANLESVIYKSTIGDINNYELLEKSFLQAKPDIVIHMAAQPLVRESYRSPLQTYHTNVMGTANLLEVLRIKNSTAKVFLNVTTDKVYENKEWPYGYRENESLGGYDPYSSSKACSELVTASYRSSYFSPDLLDKHGLSIATARAGNVIGGGDFSNDRLIPDIINSILIGQQIELRNPSAIRPWQHVLEPLAGYLMLCEKMYQGDSKYSSSWNFGPKEDDTLTVLQVVEKFKAISQSKNLWNVKYDINQNSQLHEANVLRLDTTRARNILEWKPKWNIDTAITKIVDWLAFYVNKDKIDRLCLQQISEYEETK